MVNYCCVTGCGRSSKLSNHLNFYTLPKEKPRRNQWLKVAKRDDLLKNANLKGTYRFCSRHFAPACIKNRILTSNAVPTLCLPNDDADTDSKSVSTPHHDILCDSCKKTIMGFRYKCVTCDDYDLCPKCEMLETHPGHYMLRIPKPMKFKIADNLIKKWRTFFKAEHVNPDCSDNDQSGHSSDDEPISKHVRNYDSGVDLAEDVKETIRNEITRVLALKPDARRKRKKLVDKPGKNIKKAKVDTKVSQKEVEIPKVIPEQVLEVAFADVNDYKDQVDVKNEVVPAAAGEVGGTEENTFEQPLMHVRLSDDLSELMIEMTNNGEKTVFKYT